MTRAEEFAAIMAAASDHLRSLPAEARGSAVRALVDNLREQRGHNLNGPELLAILDLP